MDEVEGRVGQEEKSLEDVRFPAFSWLFCLPSLSRMRPLLSISQLFLESRKRSFMDLEQVTNLSNAV